MEKNNGTFTNLFDSLKELSSKTDLTSILNSNTSLQLIPRFKNGNKIYIKPKNRGKFTAAAKRAGESVQEHAKSVLSNPKATTLQKRRAVFAQNARKWKHQDGGKVNPNANTTQGRVIGFTKYNKSPIFDRVTTRDENRNLISIYYADSNGFNRYPVDNIEWLRDLEKNKYKELDTERKTQETRRVTNKKVN